MPISRLSAPALFTAATSLLACAAPPTRQAVQPPACAEGHTPVGIVQGAGAATPLAGEFVTVQGVVVGDFEGPPPALGGFYIQDVRGDGDTATSDGLFVANEGRDEVRVGDIVRVTGVAGEVREQTQVTAQSVVACGRGTVEPVAVTLPVAAPDYLERYEGMLVRLPQTLYVTEHYQLGRFGEVVLSSGARLPQPTQVADPGPAAVAVQARNALNRIILDDASYEQNPATIVFARSRTPLSAANTLRGGDTTRDVVGVLTQTAASGSGGVAYRLRPLNTLGGAAPHFAAGNPRTAAPADVGGTLRIASFNLLNYFNTFAGCTAGVGGPQVDCRGARNEHEFERQWRKTVAAVVGLDADILGVIELENDGYGAGSAIADLVHRLNAATMPDRYAFIDVDARTGVTNAMGTDAIRNAFVYRTDRVSPEGRTAVLGTTRFVNGGEGEPRNRPTLLQTFMQRDGGRIVVGVNHFKSKGSACTSPDTGDGQGNCNDARTVAAEELLRWLRTDPTGTGESAVLLLGDLNSYPREDPVMTLVRGGFTDLLAARIGAAAYSYVFNGQWGYLDHALASAALLPHVTGVAEWHINADEPPILDYATAFRTEAQQQSLYAPDAFRSSDHDPVLVGVRLPSSRR